MTSLEIQFSDEGCSVSTFGNCMIVALRQQGTMPRLREIRRASQAMSAKWKSDMRSITVLEPTAISMSVPEDVRKESTALTNQFPSAATSIVVEGEGFGAAAIRPFLAGIYLVSKNAYPRKIHGSVTEGVRWVLQKTAESAAEPIQVSQLVDAIEKTRSAIKTPAK